jgi:hypothetical protein
MKEKKKNKYIINFDSKLNYSIQLLFGNMIHNYLLKFNICKNNEIFYKIDKIDEIKNFIILPIYGIYNKINVDLDNKISFYNYLDNKILNNIKLIQTYNNFKCKNIKKKYMVKHKNGAGSKNNYIIKDYLYNIIKKYDPYDYQIQDYINYNYVYGVECSCINGIIISVLTYEIKSIEKYTNYMKNIINNTIKFNEIKIMIEKIVKQLNYFGFIEFEFLITNTDIYIMECNPRISGLIISDEYFNIIIKKYIEYNLNITNILTTTTTNNYPITLKLNFLKTHYIPKTYMQLFYNMFLKNY